MSGFEANSSLLSRLAILIVTHSFVTGPAQELERFLRDKAAITAFIAHPFPYCQVTNSSVVMYEDGELTKRFVAPAIKGPDIVFYLKDILLTILFALKLRMKFDLYVGADNLNAFAGLILRRLGIVQSVVFYTIDYIPKRFDNRLLNRVYHFLDKLCCYHCDVVWNVSPIMAEARNERGVLKDQSAPQIVVPLGNNFNEIKRLPFDEINRFHVVYMGHLRKNQGVELVIEAFPKIIDRVPEARLVVIGTGPLQEELKNMVRELRLEKHVDFKGFIQSHAEVEDILTHCAVAVAPYVPHPNSFTYYADPGKPKAYMAAGLPVVITKVPRVAYEIDESKAGIAIEYDEQELVEAIVRLLTNDDLYETYRENAINFASRFTWEEIFTKAFQYTFQKL